MFNNSSKSLIISFVLLSSTLLFSCSSTKSSSSNDSETNTSQETELEDRMPYPVAGMRAIYLEMRYPEACRLAGVEGRVVIQFIVDPDGSTRNFKIIRSIHRACDREAIRVIRRAKWAPGIQDGKPITVQYQLPVEFRLEVGQANNF